MIIIQYDARDAHQKLLLCTRFSRVRRGVREGLRLAYVYRHLSAEARARILLFVCFQRVAHPPPDLDTKSHGDTV